MTNKSCSPNYACCWLHSAPEKRYIRCCGPKVSFSLRPFLCLRYARTRTHTRRHGPLAKVFQRDLLGLSNCGSICAPTYPSFSRICGLEVCGWFPIYPNKNQGLLHIQATNWGGGDGGDPGMDPCQEWLPFWCQERVWGFVSRSKDVEAQPQRKRFGTGSKENSAAFWSFPMPKGSWGFQWKTRPLHLTPQRCLGVSKPSCLRALNASGASGCPFLQRFSEPTLET